MSLMKIAIPAALLATAAGIAVVRYRPESHVVTTPATPSTPAATTQPATPHRALAQVPKAALSTVAETDAEAALAYKRTRLTEVERFDRWVREASVTPEQEMKALQVLADAQRIYDEAADVRMQLADDAIKMRDARMTPAQLAERGAARKRYTASLLRRDMDERAAASKALAEVWTKVDGDLEATAPSDEQAAFAAMTQVDDDLEEQVLAVFGDFLTPRQIDLFDSVSFYLEQSWARHANEQYAKDLAARPRR